MIVALASAKASPGVTTATLALAATWPSERSLLLIEADPDGGVLAARLGMSSDPGLSSLAVAGRRGLGFRDVESHAQQVPGSDVSVLLAPPTAEHSRRALGLVGAELPATLQQSSVDDVLVDVGRLRPGAENSPLVEVADIVLVVTRPRVEELQQLPARLRALRPLGSRLGLLLMGERPYPPAEVAVALDCEVVGVLPSDPRSASALSGSDGGSLRRSGLLRAARGVGETLRGWVEGAGPAAMDETLEEQRAGAVR